MANARRDENNVPTLLAVSSVDGTTPVNLYADPDTHRLLVESVAAVVAADAPSAAPARAGQIHVDTSGPTIYMSIGNSIVQDWVIIYPQA